MQETRRVRMTKKLIKEAYVWDNAFFKSVVVQFCHKGQENRLVYLDVFKRLFQQYDNPYGKIGQQPI